MGLTFSFHGGESMGLDESFDALLGSISFSGDYAKRNLCSKSFNGREAKPALLKAFGSGKLTIEGSVSFKRNGTDPFKLETKISFKSSSPDNEMPNTSERTCFSEEAVEAAVKLQKVYKSFRTRRQLADCAVLVEQKWWKLLDFALLKRSSVSFFNIEKPESASSKWSRARARAAKVGKGLSKNEKARKLALQHWLEAIDPRHRYGHNLHFYYACWLRCESKQPFFYWLDVGEGKEVNLETCARPKLQHQCIKYLGPKERETYEVIVEEGRLIYKKSGDLVDTTGGVKDSKWIFVLSTSKNLYVGLKRKGVFQHSSFLAGGATSAAGRLVVENGVLKAVWPHSGHYRPTEENFEEFMSFLKENNVDLTDVKKDPEEDEEEWGSTQRSRLCESSVYEKYPAEPEPPNSFHGLDVKTEVPEGSSTNHERNKLEKFYSIKERAVAEDQASEEEEEKGADSSTEANCGYETAEQSADESLEGSAPSRKRSMLCKPNPFIGEQEDGQEGKMSEELIIQRIGLKKGMKSCQLGQQLPFKWTTGAGPRIGFVRNSPSELQLSALEQVNLSPRGTRVSRPFSSPRKIHETSILKDIQQKYNIRS